MSDPVSGSAGSGGSEQPLVTPVDTVSRSAAASSLPPSSVDGPAPPYTAPYPPYPSDVPRPGGLSDNIASGLAYFVVPAVFFLLLEPYRSNALVRFHSWQSIFLFIAIAAVRSLEMMLVAMLPSAIAFFIGGVFLLLFFGVWLVCAIKAFQGSRYLLPVLGGLAAQTAASSSVR